MENNIYIKIQKIRCELQALKLKKSGKNKFAGFDYYVLDDFIPSVNQLLEKYALFTNFSIEGDNASLTIINAENPAENVVFSTPIADAQVKGATPIQCLGAIHTYTKRYLYQNAFEIVENDMLDGLAGSDKVVEGTKKTTKKESIKFTVPTIEEPISSKLNKIIDGNGSDTTAFNNDTTYNGITPKQLEFLNGCEQRLIDWIIAKMNIKSLEELNKDDAQVFINKILEKRGKIQ